MEAEPIRGFAPEKGAQRARGYAPAFRTNLAAMLFETSRAVAI